MPLGDQGYGSYVWDSGLNNWRKKHPSEYSAAAPVTAVTQQYRPAAPQETLDMRDRRLMDMRDKRLEEEEIERLNRKTALQTAKYNLEKAKLDWEDFQWGYKR